MSKERKTLHEYIKVKIDELEEIVSCIEDTQMDSFANEHIDKNSRDTVLIYSGKIYALKKLLHWYGDEIKSIPVKK